MGSSYRYRDPPPVDASGTPAPTPAGSDLAFALHRVEQSLDHVLARIEELFAEVRRNNAAAPSQAIGETSIK